MREQTYEEPLGQCTVLPPIIKAKFPSARNCVIPLCESCLLAHAWKRTPNMKCTRDLPESEGALSHDQYEVGDFVSTDQLICRTPGCFPEGYGRESADRCFQGGTIYNDAASGSFGLKIRRHLVPMRPQWANLVLSNGYGTWLTQKLNTTMAIMLFSLLRNIILSVKRKGKVSPSLGLERNTKMLEPSMLFRQSCSWLIVLWCMSPCIGQIEGRMTSRFMAFCSQTCGVVL